uniref:Uncharacterized protein n=1 Tax=Bionectria ochroleuca TaxID=29856 RepID=A0A8H7K3X4_BIOOC
MIFPECPTLANRFSKRRRPSILAPSAISPLRRQVDVEPESPRGLDEQPLLAADVDEGIDGPVEQLDDELVGPRRRLAEHGQLQRAEQQAQAVDVGVDVEPVVGQPLREEGLGERPAAAAARKGELVARL